MFRVCDDDDDYYYYADDDADDGLYEALAAHLWRPNDGNTNQLASIMPSFI